MVFMLYSPQSLCQLTVTLASIEKMKKLNMNRILILSGAAYPFEDKCMSHEEEDDDYITKKKMNSASKRAPRCLSSGGGGRSQAKGHGVVFPQNRKKKNRVKAKGVTD